jgi:ribosomal protein S18 acetylase RimI-like enzyme
MIENVQVATKADVACLSTLIGAFRDHLGQPLPDDDAILNSLERLLADSGTEFLIAFSKDRIALAYTQTRYYYSLWSTGLEAQIEDLFVLPEARRRGLGLQLIQRVIGRAQAHSCRLLVLNTNERNTAALGLYQKVGFTAERSRWQGGRQLWLERPL